MTQTARAWLGFLVAPAIPGVLLYLFGLVKGFGDAAVVGPALLAPFAYCSALVVGVPVYFVLQRRGIHSLGAYLAVGAAIGVAVVVLVFGTEAASNWTTAREHALGVLRNSVRYSLVAVTYAAGASAVFWLIAVRPQSAR